MDSMMRAYFTQTLLLTAMARALVAKGLLTKLDLLAEVARQQQISPIPQEVLVEIQALIQGIPEA